MKVTDYSTTWNSGTVAHERKSYRLGEEQDQFCETCLNAWRNRYTFDDRDLRAENYCHVCSRQYEEGEVLLAMPVTNFLTNQASICCRECYDAIKARCMAETGTVLT